MPTYQWIRDNVAILGATLNTYTLTADDVGKRVWCSITVANTTSTKTANTIPTQPVVSRFEYSATLPIEAQSSGGTVGIPVINTHDYLFGPRYRYSSIARMR